MHANVRFAIKSWNHFATFNGAFSCLQFEGFKVRWIVHCDVKAHSKCNKDKRIAVALHKKWMSPNEMNEE